jgi:DNA (cytosine-5)-methyltransferase 1
MMEIIKHSGKNINCIPKHLITSGFSSCYSRLDRDEPSVTITVNFVHPASNRCIHPVLDRALTPREGARLQSFDDDFEFFGSRSQITKQIGNAVPPLLGKAIADTIANLI